MTFTDVSICFTDLPVEDDEKDCITEEQAIKDILKKKSINPTDKTNYDPVTFLKTIERRFIIRG